MLANFPSLTSGSYEMISNAFFQIPPKKLQLRRRLCKALKCRNRFVPNNESHVACSPECAISIANASKIDQERRRDILRRHELRTHAWFIKKAQNAFNDFIRARDAGKQCICCDKTLTEGSLGGGYDCGHYRSTGTAPQLRFNEDNAHAQSKYCNRYKAGRAVEYRIGLVRRIGIDRVEELESNNEKHSFTKEELIAIREFYVIKKKQLLSNKY